MRKVMFLILIICLVFVACGVPSATTMKPNQGNSNVFIPQKSSSSLVSSTSVPSILSSTPPTVTLSPSTQQSSLITPTPSEFATEKPTPWPPIPSVETSDPDQPAQADSTLSTTPNRLLGFSYTSWWAGELETSVAKDVLKDVIQRTNSNAISVIVTEYIDTAHSWEIKKDPQKTPTEADLKTIVSYAKSKAVILTPHIDVKDNTSRTLISFNTEEEWKSFFTSYNRFIVKYATIAQKEKIPFFCVSTELSGTSNHINEWIQIIRNIKTIYTGKLIFAFNHDHDFNNNLTFLNQIDFIGISAYYPLSKDLEPTVELIKNSWIPIFKNLEKLSITYEKPIILSEVGYESKAGCTISPSKTESNVYSENCQKISYEALLQSIQYKNFIKGVLIWNVEPKLIQYSAFSFINKASESVIKKYFTEFLLETPQPTPTPISTPEPPSTPVPAPTATPVISPNPTVTPTATQTPSTMPTIIPTVTPSPTPTPMPTPTPKPTATPAPTPTPTPIATLSSCNSPYGSVQFGCTVTSETFSIRETDPFYKGNFMVKSKSGLELSFSLPGFIGSNDLKGLAILKDKVAVMYHGGTTSGISILKLTQSVNTIQVEKITTLPIERYYHYISFSDQNTLLLDFVYKMKIN